MEGLLLGVDGGATKTVALIAEPDGTILGFARNGSSDIHADPDPEQPIGRVAAAVRDAARIASVDTGELQTCVFSLCGADWPEDIAHAARLLITGPGQMKPIRSLRFELVDPHIMGPGAPGDVPHNALSDARALRAMVLGYEDRAR